MTTTVKPTGGSFGAGQLVTVAEALGVTITTVAEVLPALREGGLIAKARAFGKLLGIGEALIAAAAINLDELVKQVRELDEEDQNKVTHAFNMNLVLPNKSVEAVVEAIFKSVLKGADFVSDVIDLISPTENPVVTTEK